MVAPIASGMAIVLKAIVIAPMTHRSAWWSFAAAANATIATAAEPRPYSRSCPRMSCVRRSANSSNRTVTATTLAMPPNTVRWTVPYCRWSTNVITARTAKRKPATVNSGIL